MSARSPGGGGRTKSGKPRPGTGGYGKRKLEGKGPTPPADKRPGHPAQRKAASQARKAAQADKAGPADKRAPGRSAAPGRAPGSRADEGSRFGASDSRAGGGARGRGPESRSRGVGNAAAELVAGRNSVLEALQARVPATALHVGPRLDNDERIGQAVMLAADLGIPVVEAAGPSWTASPAAPSTRA